MIYYFVRDDNRPAGGRKVMYDHVDILNSAGIPAAILHGQRKFGRLNWFENTTPVVYSEDTEIDSRKDIVVLGETLAHSFAGKLQSRRVIFNQNAAYSWGGTDFNTTTNPYTEPGMVGVMVISDHSKKFLEYCYPGVPFTRVWYGFDPERFSYVQDKKKIIAFMPRKHEADALGALNICRWRGELSGWTVVPIDNISHDLVAEVFGMAAIYLSSGYPEGCPMPPLEALARGCVVAGFLGRGGDEYQAPALVRVEDADVLGLARALKFAVERWGKLDRLASSRWVLDRYSLDKQRESVLDFWGKLL